MAETMLIRCKTISNQSINHSGFFPPVDDVGERLQEVKYIYRPIEHFLNQGGSQELEMGGGVQNYWVRGLGAA